MAGDKPVFWERSPIKGGVSIAGWTQKGEYLMFKIGNRYWDKANKCYKETTYLSVTDLAALHFLTEEALRFAREWSKRDKNAEKYDADGNPYHTKRGEESQVVEEPEDDAPNFE